MRKDPIEDGYYFFTGEMPQVKYKFKEPELVKIKTAMTINQEGNKIFTQWVYMFGNPLSINYDYCEGIFKKLTEVK